GVVRFGAPGFAQAQRACRQPGRVGRPTGGAWPDLQGDFGRADLGLTARAWAEGVVLAVADGRGGAEHLRGNRQFAALLREDRITQLDHPVAHAVDVGLEGAWLSGLLDTGMGDVQRGQAAVVVQRYRVVDA